MVNISPELPERSRMDSSGACGDIVARLVRSSNRSTFTGAGPGAWEPLPTFSNCL